MKKLVAILLTLALCLAFVGCGAKDNTSSTPSEPASEKAKVSVACLVGPTGLGMLKLMENDENGTALNDYAFTVASDPTEITGKILNGEINIASVPTNLAAKLYKNSKGKLKMIAINTLGTLSIIENGDSVKSVADLRGKTIYLTGEGSNPEYIIRYVLKENGLDPDKDVTLQFFASAQEINPKLMKEAGAVAMLPEPAATTVLTKKDTLKRALDINAEWNKISDSPLMMGCVVALDSYISENTAAVENFLQEYSASINYVNEQTAAAAALAERYSIIASTAIAEQAIPNCSLTFVAGSDMQKEIEGYFNVLLTADKTSIGGSLPDENFYYVK